MQICPSGKSLDLRLELGPRPGAVQFSLIDPVHDLGNIAVVLDPRLAQDQAVRRLTQIVKNNR
jgi:hypothetical protein